MKDNIKTMSYSFKMHVFKLIKTDIRILLKLWTIVKLFLDLLFVF